MKSNKLFLSMAFLLSVGCSDVAFEGNEAFLKADPASTPSDRYAEYIDDLGEAIADDASDSLPIANEASQTRVPPAAESSIPVVSSNPASCARQPITKADYNELVCLGWVDFGSAFGNDENVCSFNGVARTGCRIQTDLCLSGIAVAQRYVNTWFWSRDPQATASEVAFIADFFNSDPNTVSNEMVRVWYYVCD